MPHIVCQVKMSGFTNMQDFENLKMEKFENTAGAELCQAQWKLGLAKLDLPSMKLYLSYI